MADDNLNRRSGPDTTHRLVRGKVAPTEDLALEEALRDWLDDPGGGGGVHRVTGKTRFPKTKEKENDVR